MSLLSLAAPLFSLTLNFFFSFQVDSHSSALKIGDNGLRYSLDHATRELLFVPVPSRERVGGPAVGDFLAALKGRTFE